MWTLIFLSQIFVWLAVRIKRKRFGFNRTRLSYFNEKPSTPLHHWSKNMKKHMFQWKNLFVSSFLLKWKLLKHFWKQKKMLKRIKCNIYDDERPKLNLPKISSNWPCFLIKLYTRHYKCNIGCYLYMFY